MLAPGLADPEALGEKLRAAIEDLRISDGERVTASIGCAVGPGGDVLKAADEALYAAKRGGRNRVVGTV